jgi:hypothetical protein
MRKSDSGEMTKPFWLAGTTVRRAIVMTPVSASHLKKKTLTWAIFFEPWKIEF